jgi:amidase
MVIEAGEATVGYTFGGRKAIAQVMPGEPVRLRTLDCFGGKVTGVEDLPSKVCVFPYLNPVTGPLHVVGAQPGDTLAVHLIDLTPIGAMGFSATFPHFGALTGTDHTAMLHPPLDEVVWQYPIDHARGTVRFLGRRSAFERDLPLRPMLGTVGVAPAGGETRLSMVPGAHGGNLDTAIVQAGTTLYLPVNVEGALLAVGDGHAAQGDGELCGVGVEVAMDVTLVVEVLPGVATRWPRFETDDRIGAIGIARPLEDAYRGACRRLVDDVTAMTGMDPLDAYQFVSQASRAWIGNVVDAEYTITATVPKGLLLGAEPYYGVHRALRGIGASQ